MMNVSILTSLPLRIESTPNKREHWAVKARRTKEHRHLSALMLTSKLSSVLVLRDFRAASFPVHVTLTRVAPRALDGDNLQGGLKAVRDGVADALGIDDGDSRVTWSYEQRRGEPKSYRVDVQVCVKGGDE
jgi:hypothetical protein